MEHRINNFSLCSRFSSQLIEVTCEALQGSIFSEHHRDLDKHFPSMLGAKPVMRLAQEDENIKMLLG